MSDNRLLDYYQGRHDEAERLKRGPGRLEFARTVELLDRHLNERGSRVVDIGGGTGVYSARLAARGFEVELIDPVPSHVEAATEEATEAGSFTAKVGDARSLESADDEFDAALLLGPLYHLRSRADRRTALSEARRVVRPGGLLFVAFITRGSVFLDAFLQGWPDGPNAQRMMSDVARSGKSEGRSGFGAVSYFHTPDEARSELLESGLVIVDLIGVEGPGWVACDFDERWQDPERREGLMQAARSAETCPELVGLSAHLLAVCRNPDPGTDQDPG